ncbi:MAG: sensor histidine kinase [Chloroflexota bacterium]
MKQRDLEFGLLSVFRLLTTFRFGLEWMFVFIRIVNIALGDSPPDKLPETLYEGVRTIEVTLLILYLWWPGLSARLGNRFLPLGLLFATIGPMLGHHSELLTEFNETEAGIVSETWQVFLVLFIPLILTGWQYDLRKVIFFSIGTALLDSVLTVLSGYVGNPHVSSLLGLITVRTGTYILVGYMVVQLMKNQRQQRQALAEANEQLTHFATTLEQLTISRERNRLAREMHDTLAHTLSGTAVQLEAIKTLWDTAPDDVRMMLAQSSEEIRIGLAETRRALLALRASPLEDLGLVLAVRELAESTVDKMGAVLDWQSAGQFEHLVPAVEQGVYRIAQEALANIGKHAAARTVTVQLTQSDDQIVLKIADDGVGFDPGQIDSQHHFGLLGMQERARMIDGQLSIESSLGNGTSIHLVIHR